MTALLIGYARCSTDEQDLTVQREGLASLGVTPDRIYVDHGLTGSNRERPGLREALAACRDGDTLVVTKLDDSPAPAPRQGNRGRTDHSARPASTPARSHGPAGQVRGQAVWLAAPSGTRLNAPSSSCALCSRSTA